MWDIRYKIKITQRAVQAGIISVKSRQQLGFSEHFPFDT